jgi:hypothetical protein
MTDEFYRRFPSESVCLFSPPLELLSTTGASAGAIERVFLDDLGELLPHSARPPLRLEDLDARVLHLQTHLPIACPYGSKLVQML